MSAPKAPRVSPAGAFSKTAATSDIPTRVGHLINNVLLWAAGKSEVPERFPEKKPVVPAILEEQRSPLRQEAHGAQLAPLIVKGDDEGQKNGGPSRQVPVSEKTAGTTKPSNVTQEAALHILAETSPHSAQVPPRPMEHKQVEAELFKKGLHDKPNIKDNQRVADEKLPPPAVIKPMNTAHAGKLGKEDKKISPPKKEQNIELKELKLPKPTEAKTACEATVAGGVGTKKKRKGRMHSEKKIDSSEEDVRGTEKALPQVEQTVAHLRQPTSKKATYGAVSSVETAQAVGETKLAPEKSQKHTHHHEGKFATLKKAHVRKDTTRTAKPVHGQRASKKSKQQRHGSDIPTVKDVSANLTATTSNSALAPACAPRKVAKRRASKGTRHIKSVPTVGNGVAGTTAIPTSRFPSTVGSPARTTKSPTAATSAANTTRGMQ
ncbi:hypothetical protein MTO96_004697 [Rhipicephalus appendiculatus]